MDMDMDMDIENSNYFLIFKISNNNSVIGWVFELFIIDINIFIKELHIGL